MTRPSRRITVRAHAWWWKIPLLYLTVIYFLGWTITIWHIWDPTADPGLGPIWMRQAVVACLMAIGMLWLPSPRKGRRSQ